MDKIPYNVVELDCVDELSSWASTTPLAVAMMTYIVWAFVRSGDPVLVGDEVINVIKVKYASEYPAIGVNCGGRDTTPVVDALRRFAESFVKSSSIADFISFAAEDRRDWSQVATEIMSRY